MHVTGATHGLSHCFFPFPERGYMALCVLGTSIQHGSDSAFLACCPFLTNPPLFSLFFFHFESPQTWKPCRPHPWPPTLHHVPYIAFFPGLGGPIVSSFSLFFSLAKANPLSLPSATLSFFILDLLPFPETLCGNTCTGVWTHCFQSSLPHLVSCRAGLVVVWVSATWILFLCYHSTSATETQWWHVKTVW